MASRLIPVADPLDPRVEAYRQVRDRDLAGRDGAFILEGRVVIEKAVAAGRHPIRSLLLAERRPDALGAVLDGLPADTPVYVASQAVMDAIAGFPIHRGVLGLGERTEPAPDALLRDLPRAEALVVALAGIANHDNMGGLFRNAAAFGADAVILTADCCDPLYRKAIRVSVGAAVTLPFARLPSGADLVGRLEAAGLAVAALSPGGRLDLARFDPAPRQAVVFGAEGPGLPAEVLARAQTVRIPMRGGFDSLNVATASGIVLHSLRAAQARI